VFDKEDVITCGCTCHLAFPSSIAPALVEGSAFEAILCRGPDFPVVFPRLGDYILD